MKSGLLLSCLLLCFVVVVADEPSESDAEYVASFVSKLDSYVTWPSDRVAEGNGDLFVISAVGESIVLEKLRGLAGEKSAGGLKIKFRKVRLDLLPSNSHVLFIASDAPLYLEKILAPIKGTKTFTVSMGEGFALKGCMMNFFHENVGGEKKVKAEINVDAIKAESLSVKPALLKIASVMK